jgi:hypothetical protein
MKEFFKKGIIKKVGVLLTTGMASVFALGVSAYPALGVKADEANNEIISVVSQVGEENAISVSDYKLAITLNENSTVDVSETVTVEFVGENSTSFYREIPQAFDKISNVTAVCAGNNEFSYMVTGDETSAIIQCFGGVKLGSVWTYELDYTVAIDSSLLGEEIVFSIVDEDWQTTIKNVEAEITLPDSIVNYDIYNADGEIAPDVAASISQDGKTIKVSSQPKAVAASSAIMVKVVLPDEDLIKDFNATMERAEEWIWPPLLPWLLAILVVVVCSILLIVF